MASVSGESLMSNVTRIEPIEINCGRPRESVRSIIGEPRVAATGDDLLSVAFGDGAVVDDVVVVVAFAAEVASPILPRHCKPSL